jgi:hypothetical protein
MGRIVQSSRGPCWERRIGDKILNALQLPVPEDDPAIAIVTVLLFLTLSATFTGLLYFLGWLLPFGPPHSMALITALAEYAGIGLASFGLAYCWFHLQDL